ncbi:MAG: zinc ribbon domain-containing protein [Planctomycetes bacterium]|nr:zinc ribbon domain-containing protein [Planctomycetota bacterium]
MSEHERIAVMFHEALSSATSDYSAGLAAEQAQFAAHRVEDELIRMQADIERLLLITEGLWKVLKEEHGYDDDELVRRVLEVDLKDGKIDGKVASQKPGDCPHCDRPLSQDRRYCLYCGEPTPIELFSR